MIKTACLTALLLLSLKNILTQWINNETLSSTSIAHLDSVTRFKSLLKHCVNGLTRKGLMLYRKPGSLHSHHGVDGTCITIGRPIAE